MLIDRCLCGSGRWPRFFGVAGLAFAECECGVIHLHEDMLPGEYESQYRGSYHASADRHPGCIPYVNRYQHDLEVAGRRWRRYCELAQRKIANVRRSLDVGAANGAFVDYLRSIGIDAFGIDPDPAMCRKWIRTGTASDVYGRHDLVTYHDVLEHVLDPAAELEVANNLLEDRGLLVIDVPDVSVPEGRHHYKLEHPWYFTEESLSRMLKGAGLEQLATDRPVAGKLVVYACPVPRL